jgi:hypothetical protein
MLIMPCVLRLDECFDENYQKEYELAELLKGVSDCETSYSADA